MTSRFFWKLYAGYILVVLLMALVSVVVISHQVTQVAREEVQNQLEHETRLLVPLARPFFASSSGGLQTTLDRASRDTGNRYTIIGNSGKVIADTWEDPAAMDNHGTRPEVLEAKTGILGTSQRFSDTAQIDMVYVARAVRENDRIVGYARAARPLHALAERTALLRSGVIKAVLWAVILGLIPSLFLARRIGNPLSDLRTSTRRLAMGDYETPVNRVQSPEELAQLSQNVESMRQVLRDRVESITRDRNKLAAMLSGMVEGVVAIDVNERLLHINEAACSIFRTTVQESQGRRIWELPNSREVGEALEECIQEGSAFMREVKMGDHRSEWTVEVLTSPLRDGAGGIAGAMAVLHDITHIRKLEKVRRDFVANASHELSTPITGILGSVDTLLDDPGIPENTRMDFLHRIRSSADRLAELTRDLNTLTRLEDHERGDPGQTDIVTIVGESLSALEPAAQAKGLELRRDLPPDSITVTAWREDLRLVVDNLVNNAIKYTPSGTVTVSLSSADGFARLAVKDTGLGIEPIHLERIFERFYRVDGARVREAGGSGLGLSIVRNVARSLGGSVSVSSTPGAGSEFTVVVPLSPAA